MKKIVSILAIVLISINVVQAQSVFSIHAVRVEGNIQNFEKVQKILSKGAQAAVNNGAISAWLFFEVVKTDGVDDENGYNYVFAQSANNIDQLLDPKFAWWYDTQLFLASQNRIP